MSLHILLLYLDLHESSIRNLVCWALLAITHIDLGQTFDVSLSLLELGLWIFLEACIQMGFLQGEAGFASPDSWRGFELEPL